MSFRARVIAMKIGDVITVPVTEVGYTTIRGYASDLGFAFNRKYATRRNKDTRSYSIIRIA